MSAHEPARPAPRAFWADARFLLGIALIVASVAGVWLIVAAARQSEPVFAATRTIVPGDEVTASDLRVVEVALGAMTGAYASPVDLEPGSVAVRTITEGELVPRSALGERSASTRTSVVIRTGTEVAASVGPGSEVEVWVAPSMEDGRHAAPRILVPAATVASVDREGAIVSSTAVSIELVIARADVAAVLAALADDSVLSVVPAAGASR